MGYVSCVGACYICRRLFEFNARLVPSIRVQGKRQPVCATCVEQWNAARGRAGLAPVVPIAGAYEAASESEVFGE